MAFTRGFGELGVWRGVLEHEGIFYKEEWFGIGWGRHEYKTCEWDDGKLVGNMTGNLAKEKWKQWE